jgi:hypothetical protein
VERHAFFARVRANLASNDGADATTVDSIKGRCASGNDSMGVTDRDSAIAGVDATKTTHDIATPFDDLLFFYAHQHARIRQRSYPSFLLASHSITWHHTASHSVCVRYTKPEGKLRALKSWQPRDHRALLG